MNKKDLKIIAEGLVETFNMAGKESIELFKKGDVPLGIIN